MEVIHLAGVEEVQRAAGSMRSAAAEMNQAAANFGGYVHELAQLLERFERSVESLQEMRR